MLINLFKKNKAIKNNDDKLEIDFTKVFDKIEEIATAKFIFHDDQYSILLLY